MKRNSRSYRLQLIKEAVERRERRSCSDPMARYIGHLLDEQPMDNDPGVNHRFAGHHFDEDADGWVSDKWSSMK